MVGFKLAALAGLDLDYRALLSEQTNDELASVASTFRSNIARVVSAAVFQVRVLNLSQHFLRYWEHAERKVMGEDAHADSRRAEFLEKRDQITAACKALSRTLLVALEGSGDEVGRRWDDGFYFIDAMTVKSGPYLVGGIEAMLFGLLVSTWTAFETLAGDLWVAAVNTSPRYLAPLTGTARRIEKLSRSSRARRPAAKSARGTAEPNPGAENDLLGPRTQKQISLGDIDRITQGTYNLANKMGQLLVEAKRIQFTSLEGIREAYSLAFSENMRHARTDRIDASLADKALDALSAVRHVIVHKAGVADAAYLEDAKHAPQAPQSKLNEQLKVDGEMCRDLINPVIRACGKLIEAVDTWLTLSCREAVPGEGRAADGV